MMKEQVRPPIGQESQKNWMERNWKWFVPVIVVASMAAFVAFFAGIVYFVFAMMKSSGAYEGAVAIAVEHPAVQEMLGTPIKEGLLVTGSINLNGDDGEADIEIPLSGPNGKGTLYVDATKTDGAWSFSTLTLEVRSSGERINLLE